MKEFIVLRRGEPIIFGLDLVGVTWVSKEHIFDKPIEKIGQDLELFWDGKLVENSKNGVVSVIAHWKRVLTRRAKRLEVSLEQITDLARLTREERHEMLASVDRVSPLGERVEVLVLRRGRGANASYRTLVRAWTGRKLVSTQGFTESTKEKVAAKAKKMIRALDFSEQQLNETPVFGYSSMEAFLEHDVTENRRSRPFEKAFV